jgi:hypothetical protein
VDCVKLHLGKQAPKNRQGAIDQARKSRNE